MHPNPETLTPAPQLQLNAHAKMGTEDPALFEYLSQAIQARAPTPEPSRLDQIAF
jgi:hypothetical protein